MRKLFWIFGIALLGAILLSFLLSEYNCFREPFTYFKDALGVIQLAISVLIVYLLYDRFGTSRKILDKQNELIIEYIEELKKIQIFLSVTLENNETQKLSFNLRKDLSSIKSHEFSDRTVLFKREQMYEELQRLNQLVEHPLFPVKLKKHADIFKFVILTNQIALGHNNVAYLSVSFDHQNPNDLWVYPHQEYTVIEYLTLIEIAVEQIEKWVNHESSIKIELNIE